MAEALKPSNMNELNILLSKYLSGEADPEEAMQVEDWIAASPENKTAFLQLAAIVAPSQPYQVAEPASEWQDFLHEAKPFRPSWKIAVFWIICIVCVVIASVVLYRYTAYNKPTSQQRVVVQTGVASVLDTNLLAYHIYLDEQSRISFSVQNLQETPIQLMGGAFIMAADSTDSLQKGWIVDGTTVLPQPGAAFYLAYDSASKKAEVQVQSGAVLLRNGQLQQTVSANEAMLIADGRLQSIAKNANKYSFVTRVFDFADTPLPQVLADISKAYGVEIIMLTPALKHCRLTVLFENKPLQEVLDIIAFTLGFEYQLGDNNKKVTIVGKGCK